MSIYYKASNESLSNLSRNESPQIYQPHGRATIYTNCQEASRKKGVTLAQLVKASVGQADVLRFEPHLGHN